MNIPLILESISATGVSALILYVSFGKKLIEKTAEKVVEKMFLKSIETEKEEIKHIFNKSLEKFKKTIQVDIAKEVEPLRASLSRENIAFQIINTEYTKLKFIRLDALYLKLNELKNFSQKNFLFPNNAEDAELRRQAFFLKYQETEVAMHQASLYVEESVYVAAIGMLNACQSAFGEFNKMVVSDRIASLNSNNPELVRNFATQSSNAFDRLINSLDSLPSVLREIEDEFKKHITASKIVN